MQAWTAVGTDQATKTIAGPIVAGGSSDLTIVLKVGASQQGNNFGKQSRDQWHSR
jgi:hypothetical protein